MAGRPVGFSRSKVLPVASRNLPADPRTMLQAIGDDIPATSDFLKASSGFPWTWRSQSFQRFFNSLYQIPFCLKSGVLLFPDGFGRENRSYSYNSSRKDFICKIEASATVGKGEVGKEQGRCNRTVFCSGVDGSRELTASHCAPQSLGSHQQPSPSTALSQAEGRSCLWRITVSSSLQPSKSHAKAFLWQTLTQNYRERREDSGRAFPCFLCDVEETGEGVTVMQSWQQTLQYECSSHTCPHRAISDWAVNPLLVLHPSWTILFLVVSHIQLLAIYVSSGIQIWLCPLILGTERWPLCHKCTLSHKKYSKITNFPLLFLTSSERKIC